MQIAVWNTPFTHLVTESLRAAWPEGVRSGTAADAENALRAGEVDVALLPTHTALLGRDDFDVLPAVGISTWANPFTTLTLPDGLESGPVHIRHSHDGQLPAFVAKIVLKEHYSIVASTSESETGSPDVDPLGLTMASSGRETTPVLLDLGMEWYELANYPMVWAVFAMRKDTSTPQAIASIRDVVVALDDERRDRVLQGGASEEVQEFELNDLRLRLDDLALASLTEFTEYLYFHEQADAIEPVPFVSLPDDA